MHTFPRHLCASTGLALAALVTPAAFGQSLLQNGGAEAGLANWTASNGFSTSAAVTFDGNASFHAGAFGPAGAWTSRLSQDVDLSLYAAAIDGGAATIAFGGRARSSASGGTTDFASIELRVLDGSGVELASWLSGNVTPANSWVAVEHVAALPVSARTLRVTLVGRRTVAGSTDAYFDALAVAPPSAPLGTVYCAGVANSTGAAATLAASGSDVAADNQLRLAASQLPPSALGMFIASRMQGSIPGVGGGQGTLCVVSSVSRFNGAGQMGQASATGELSLEVDLTDFPTPLGFVAVAAGETWNFQAWYRDSNPSPTSNFSEAREITFR